MGNDSNDGDLGLVLKKGNFSQVPNEMLDFFADRTNLNGREYRLCFALMRELVGWDYKFKPIELCVFMEKTHLSKSHASEGLKSLVEKEVIEKRRVPGYRTPCYGFREDQIGRVIVSEYRHLYVDGKKVIDLNEFKLLKEGTSSSQIRELQVPDIGNQKRRDQATSAASQTSKYPQIPLNTSLRRESEKDSNEWDENGPQKAEQIRKMIQANFRGMPS